MARTLKVEIVGDSSSLSNAFKKAGSAGSGFGSSLGKLAKYGALAAGAAGIGGLAVVLKTGFAEFSQGTKVAAQTNAVIKSTGGIAHITATQVDALASSQMRKTGADDEAVKTGENMLLTFTNIRNEVGKNNDIFNQATKITQDMATAMNGGAIPSSEQMAKQAILVGKALNDPITGMSALHRVGVAFTEDQKKQVAAMVKSGDAMGAQKLILGELNKEFGGSAEAIGKTLPGQLSILKESFNNIAGDIVTGLVPSLQALATWTSAHSAEIGAAMQQAFDIIGVAIRDVITVGEQLLGFYQRHSALVQIVAGAVAGAAAAILVISTAVKIWTAAQLLLDAALSANPIGLVVLALAALGGALVVAYTKSETFRNIVTSSLQAVRTAITSVVNTAQALWARFGGDVMAAVGVVVGQVHRIEAAVSSVITLVGDLIHGRWSKIWGDVKEVAVNALNAMYGLFYSAGKHLVEGFIGGIKSMAKSVGDAAANVAKAAYDGAAHFLRLKSPSRLFHDMGVNTMLGYINGIVSMAPKAGAAMTAAMGFVAADARRGVAEVIMTIEGMWEKVKSGPTTGGSGLPMTPTQFKNTSGQYISDDYIAAQIDASIAANPNASPGGAVGVDFSSIPTDAAGWAALLGKTSKAPYVKMAAGGRGTVSGPTMFMAGEAGREDFAFSGANKSFGGSGQTINHFHFPQYLGTRQEVIAWVRDGLTRAGHRDPDIFGGVA